MVQVVSSVFCGLGVLGCGFDVEEARKRGFGLLGMTERVRLLGGECTIFSTPHAGTHISAHLPIPQPAGEEE